MSRGGRQYGKAHSPRESCHSFSAWGAFERATLWSDTVSVKWRFLHDSVILAWKRDGHSLQQEIPLKDAPCYFGGRRLWLECPRCRRRVGKIYLPCAIINNGRKVEYWQCRHCWDLTYVQRQERTHGHTYDVRVETFAERYLISEGNVFVKAKWQHMKTFERLVSRYNKLLDKANSQIW